MNKIKNWTNFNESNTYTYTLLNKNDEVVEIEADDIDDANRKMMKLYKGTDPMLTHMNGKLIDWNRPTANFGAMKESNGYDDDDDDDDDDDFSDEFDDDLEEINDKFNITGNALHIVKSVSEGRDDLNDINQFAADTIQKINDFRKKRNI